MMLQIKPIGIVHSSLKNIGDCPLLEHENAPEATIEIFQEYASGLSHIKAGDRLILFTWLHLADREVLQTRPRNNNHAPMTGVFSTRSPDRPNPIGIHIVRATSVSPLSITVSSLEVLDQTPVIDIKPVLTADEGELS